MQISSLGKNLRQKIKIIFIIYWWFPNFFFSNFRHVFDWLLAPLKAMDCENIEYLKQSHFKLIVKWDSAVMIQMTGQVLLKPKLTSSPHLRSWNFKKVFWRSCYHHSTLDGESLKRHKEKAKRRLDNVQKFRITNLLVRKLMDPKEDPIEPKLIPSLDE